jgi:hypothetical protein
MKHELVSTLQALILEQSRFDKEHENASAAVATKYKEAPTEVPLILPPDTATRKQRHSTKNILQSKGEKKRNVLTKRGNMITDNDRTL